MPNDDQLMIDQQFDQAAQLVAQGNPKEARLIAESAVVLAKQQFGEQSSAYAKALNALGVVVFDTAEEAGDLERSRQLFWQAYQLQSGLERGSRWRSTVFLLNLGKLYLGVHGFDAADAYIMHVLDLFRGVESSQAEPVFQLDSAILFGPGTESSITWMLPTVDGSPSGPRSTASLYLQMRRELIEAVHNLANGFLQQGDYRKALPRFEQALVLKQELYQRADDPPIINSLRELAWVNHSIGNYGRARELFDVVLQRVHSLYQRPMLGLMEVLEDGRVIPTASQRDERPEVASVFNDLAIVNLEAGDYAAARRLIRDALDLDRAALGEQSAAVGRDVEHLGWIYHHIGNYRRAEASYQEALAINKAKYGDQSLEVAAVLNRLGLLYHKQGDISKAARLLETVLQLRLQALPPDRVEIAESYNNLGLAYQDLIQYSDAERLARQALKLYRDRLGGQHPYVAYTLGNLARLFAAQGKYEEAETYLRDKQELQHKILGPHHPDLSTTLMALAHVYVARQRIDEAYIALMEAASIDDLMLGQVFSSGSEYERMAYLASIRSSFYVFLSLIIKDRGGDPVTIRSGLAMVLRRKGLSAEVLATQRDAILGGRYPQLARELNEVLLLRAQIQRLTLTGPTSNDPDYQHRLAVWTAESERLEAGLAHQIPEMSLEQQLRTANRHSIAQSLPEGTALVEFVHVNVFDFWAKPANGEAQWQSAHYLAFILPAGAPDDVRMVDLGEADPIDSLVAQFRQAIHGDEEDGDERTLSALSLAIDVTVQSDQPTLRAVLTAARSSRPPVSNLVRLDLRALGTTLRQTIFDPLLPALGGYTRLFLAPDGDLSRLPFEVLPLDETRYLIDDYQLSYLTVGRDVLRFGVAPTCSPSRPLVVADPNFDLGHATTVTFRPGVPFQPLSGTRQEGEQVAAFLQVPDLRADEVLEQVISKVPSPRILHIATHGFFLPDPKRDPNQGGLGGAFDSTAGGSRFDRLATVDNPLLRSGLALAGANTWLQQQDADLPPEAQDGLLTALDVTGMDLLDTELVVLSACETGLGSVQVGEGVFGLRRAFVLAGAKTLVMSLWKVPDDATQQLMELFYREVLAGTPRAEALRAAQLKLRADYPEPRFWGAFICQGDPGPLGKAEAEVPG